jgi:hypothetical protein
MRSHSVIYIDQPLYERVEKSGHGGLAGCADTLLSHLDVAPLELPDRVISSFVPPILGEKSKKVYVDLVGPVLAVLFLSLLLHYGHANKHPEAALNTSPTMVLLYYCLTMPLLCFSLVKLGGSSLGLADILALLGYGLYGHVFTVLTSLMVDSEAGNIFFFIAMSIFGGLSGLRIVIVLLLTIPRPVARLLVCSIVSIVHLLFLVFIHFAYMHRTFVYGADLASDY